MVYTRTAHFSDWSFFGRRLKDLQVNEESEIDWKALVSKARWNCWSPHDVRRRWVTLKGLVDGHEMLSFSGTFTFLNYSVSSYDINFHCTEVVEVLKTKFAEPPENAEFVGGQWVSSKKKSMKAAAPSAEGRVYRSSEVILEEDEVNALVL